MLVKIKDLVVDESIYPRHHINQKTIELYAERLQDSIKFPPIEIQRVKQNGAEQLLVIDGIHRIEAHKEAKLNEIKCEHWQPNKVFDRDNTDEWVELKLHACEVNCNFGDRLSYSDAEANARAIIEKNPNYPEVQLAKRLGVRQQTISNWVSDIKRRYDASQDNIIFRLHLLGWTQEEIGKVKGVELVHSVISERLSELPKLVKTTKESYSKKKSIAEIAEYHNIDQTLTWTLILQELFDDDRLATLKLKPQIYNVWNFASNDERIGQDHRGRIPGQIAINTLYYYTQPDDLIIDPMAGGGSTDDACLLMGRHCYSFDIEPTRVDIRQNDMADGFPTLTKKADMIFLDPPYWNLMDKFYPDGSASECTYDNWLKFIETLAANCYSLLKPQGYVALITEALVDETGNKAYHDLPFDCLGLFKGNGFNLIHRISVPVNTQVKSGRDVNFAKSKRMMLDINRDLLIMRK